MTDHIGDTNKMVSDTPRMKVAQMAAMEHGTGDVWRVGCDIERELNAANDRIKRLEEESWSRWNLAESAIASCDKMASRIKRLEEAGDEILRDNQDMANVNRWWRAKEAKP